MCHRRLHFVALASLAVLAACGASEPKPAETYPTSIYDQSADDRRLSSTGVAAVIAANDGDGIAGLLAAGYVLDKGIDCAFKGKCKKLLFHKPYEPYGPGTRCKGDPYGVNAKQHCFVERVPTDIEKSITRERAKAGFMPRPSLPPKPPESERMKAVRQLLKNREAR